MTDDQTMTREAWLELKARVKREWTDRHGGDPELTEDERAIARHDFCALFADRSCTVVTGFAPDGALRVRRWTMPAAARALQREEDGQE